MAISGRACRNSCVLANLRRATIVGIPASLLIVTLGVLVRPFWLWASVAVLLGWLAGVMSDRRIVGLDDSGVVQARKRFLPWLQPRALPAVRFDDVKVLPRAGLSPMRLRIGTSDFAGHRAEHLLEAISHQQQRLNVQASP